MARSNLEDEVTTELSEQLAAEIDREILWGFLIGAGWAKVELGRFQNNNHAIDIRIWIEENTKGKFLQSGARFLFEDPRDATMFALRWYDRN